MAAVAGLIATTVTQRIRKPGISPNASAKTHN